MARSLALLAVAAAAVGAQTTTVDIFLPIVDKQPLDASIVGGSAEATTFAIHCPKGTPSDECGLPGTQTVIAGPSTVHYTYSVEGDGDEYGYMTQDLQCSLDSKRDMATCSITMAQEISGSEESQVTTTSAKGYLEFVVPVTVTAGFANLKSASAGDDDASAGASATDSESTGASKPKATGAAATDAVESTSAAGSDAAATPVSTDNAAGPMVTQNAVLAGVAAVVGGAAMLL
ncbi:hypothetical protein FALBO_9797 [Fusarium albosuccineum]|uniref:Uncharacterized protein n=1 Tax=Fusarium albosuccineum TaxID=1237068 RepID=A0A8H4L883_9HYPO|nr:hypothetical protein FALBO_9797 [Fusarium albosuccineum]